MRMLADVTSASSGIRSAIAPPSSLWTKWSPELVSAVPSLQLGTWHVSFP